MIFSKLCCSSTREFKLPILLHLSLFQMTGIFTPTRCLLHLLCSHRETTTTPVDLYNPEQDAIQLQDYLPRTQKKWKHLMKRVAFMLSNYQLHLKTFLLLGKTAYEATFSPILLPDWEQRRESWQNKEQMGRPFSRVIPTKNGEIVVGRRLTNGKGPQDLSARTADPAICQHPQHKMQMRGGRGKTASHWICQDCCARWERQPLEDYQRHWAEEPNHLDLVTFGTLCGLQFKEAYKNSAFCQYARDTKEYGHPVDKGCVRFVDYCNLMDAGHESSIGMIAASTPRRARSSSSTRRRNVSFSTNTTRADSRGRTRPGEEFSMTSDGDTKMVEEPGYTVPEQH